MPSMTMLFSVTKEVAKKKVRTSQITNRNFSFSIHRNSHAERLLSPQFQTLQPKSVKGVVLDWSGTTVDPHVISPSIVFEEIFKKHGLPISNEEARLPMGIRKDLHIAEILEIPEVQQRFFQLKGRHSTQEDVEEFFVDAVPLQLEILPKYSTLIPGTVEVVERLRELDIKIGCSTGFTEKMVDIVLREAKKQGYIPDSSVAGDQVQNGTRPMPHMIFKNMDNLGIDLPGEVVKVDDTVVGVGEGISAGAWSVGIYGVSNYTGVKSLEHLKSMSKIELEQRQENSKRILNQSGAHYIIKNISQLPGVVQDINQRLKNGETPVSGLEQQPRDLPKLSL